MSDTSKTPRIYAMYKQALMAILLNVPMGGPYPIACLFASIEAMHPRHWAIHKDYLMDLWLKKWW